MTFTSEQQEAFNSICQFFQSTDQVFILRGSAGTGKTTLLAALVEHMEQKG
ncbi:MAG: AAA family ATPase, partial [Bacteroides sp.]|nr:AAA family ATPase [Bacteroides sp.]